VGSGGPRARSELPCSLALRKNVKDVTTADGSRGGCRTRAPRSRSRWPPAGAARAASVAGVGSL